MEILLGGNGVVLFFYLFSFYIGVIGGKLFLFFFSFLRGKLPFSFSVTLTAYKPIEYNNTTNTIAYKSVD